MSKIKVTRYRSLEKPSALVAILSVIVPKWGGFFINDLKLFQTNGKFWIKMPDREYEKDGKKQYAPYCGFENRETSELFQAKILLAIDEYARDNARREEQKKTNVELPKLDPQQEEPVPF